MSVLNRFSGKTKAGSIIQYGYTANIGRYLVYVSHRTRNEHFHRNKRSWAISAAIVDWLRAERVQFVIIDVKDEGKYYTRLPVLVEFGMKGQYEGWDDQYFLSEGYWQLAYQEGIIRTANPIL